MAEEKKTVKVEKQVNKNRVFVGKGWNNKNDDGSTYMNLSFDKKFEVRILDTEENVEYEILTGTYLQGNPNTKRDGKKDADVRFSFKLNPNAEVEE